MALLVIAGTGTLSFTSAAAPSSSLSLSSSVSSCRRHFAALSFSRTETLASHLSVVAAPVATAPADALPSSSLFVYCGRGDKKTAKGKRFRHSFGNARPRSKKNGRGPPRAPAPPAPRKKDKFDDGEIVKIEINESLFS